jgi:hypothetical protein
MNKRVFLAGVLSAVAMFLWSGIAHMALPLGKAGVQQIDKEDDADHIAVYTQHAGLLHVSENDAGNAGDRVSEEGRHGTVGNDDLFPVPRLFIR